MMASNKSTQYWLVALKVLLLVLALGYILLKINNENTLVVANFTTIFQFENIAKLFLFIGFAALNWGLEILKWRTTVRVWFPLSYKQATRQCLGSLTASLITPNRIGEYGAKALYYLPKDRKKIVFLNFIHSSFQMLTTVLFGIPALFYFMITHQIEITVNKIFILMIVITVLSVTGYIFRKKQLRLKGFSLNDLWYHYKQIAIGSKLAILLMSMARYIVFSCLFYLLLQFYGVSIQPIEAMVCIGSMYLLVSVVPSFFIMDVVIRGSVAVWLFSFFDVSEIAVLATVFSMWILNTVLPAIIGSYYVLTFKLNKE